MSHASLKFSLALLTSFFISPLLGGVAQAQVGNVGSETVNPNPGEDLTTPKREFNKKETGGALKMAPTTAPSSSPSPMASPEPSATPAVDGSDAGATETKPEHLVICVTTDALERPAKRWRLGLAVGLNLDDSMEFDHVMFNSGTETVDHTRLSYDGAPSASIGLEALYGAKNAWGGSVGFTFDSRRAVKSPEFASVGGASVTQIDSSVIRVAVLYGNFIYRWSHWYLPLGINVSSVNVENPSIALRDVFGGFGGQLGVGYMFDEEKFAVEFVNRSIGLRGTSQTDGTRTIDVRRGTLTTAQLNLKAYF